MQQEAKAPNLRTVGCNEHRFVRRRCADRVLSIGRDECHTAADAVNGAGVAGGQRDAAEAVAALPVLRRGAPDLPRGRADRGGAPEMQLS